MIKTEHSGIAKKTPNPVINEAFTFLIPVEHVQDLELMITLYTSEEENSYTAMLGKNVELSATSCWPMAYNCYFRYSVSLVLLGTWYC